MRTKMIAFLLLITVAVFSQDEVVIGTQTWKTSNQDNGKGTYYTYNGVKYTQFGKLYTKEEAMSGVNAEGGQGICPEGWHVPTSSDWATLIAYAGGNPIAGRNLRSTGNKDWFTPFTWPGYTQAQRDNYNAQLNGWDTYGFAMKPSGYQNKYGNFAMIGKYAYFWTSSMVNGWDTYIYNGYSSGAMHQYQGFVDDLVRFPVRCIKN